MELAHDSAACEQHVPMIERRAIACARLRQELEKQVGFQFTDISPCEILAFEAAKKRREEPVLMAANSSVPYFLFVAGPQE
jgi:hypothetical protein